MRCFYFHFFQILQDHLTSEKSENEQLKNQIEILKTSAEAAETGDTSGLVEENQHLREEIEQLKASYDGNIGGGDSGGGISGSVGVSAAVVAATLAASEEEMKRLKDERNKMQEEKINAQKVFLIGLYSLLLFSAPCKFGACTKNVQFSFTWTKLFRNKTVLLPSNRAATVTLSLALVILQ